MGREGRIYVYKRSLGIANSSYSVSFHRKIKSSDHNKSLFNKKRDYRYKMMINLVSLGNQETHELL